MALIHMQGFREYTPETLWFGEGIYLQDEDGRDWYEWREYFSKKTMKILYEPDGDNHIASVVKEGWQFLNPIGMNLVEVKPAAIPKAFTMDGTWSFVDGKVVQLPSVKAKVVRTIRNEFLDKTDLLITPHYTLDDIALSEKVSHMVVATRAMLKQLPKQPGFPDGAVEIPELFFKLAVRHGFNPEWLQRAANFCPFKIV